MKNPIMVICWAEKTKLVETGQVYRPDGVNWEPRFDIQWEGKACVWSSEPKRFDDGYKHAKQEGYSALVLEDSNSVLNDAREYAVRHAQWAEMHEMEPTN